MTLKKKRKADRVYLNDPEGELDMPVRKTKEIADKHLPQVENNPLKGRVPTKDVGEREDGKELFDFVLKEMAKPTKD